MHAEPSRSAGLPASPRPPAISVRHTAAACVVCGHPAARRCSPEPRDMSGPRRTRPPHRPGPPGDGRRTHR